MAKIERDASGKTRVAKGDKSGLGGQFAPDPELLKKYAEQARKFHAAQSRYASPEERDSLSVQEYNEGIIAREALQDYYTIYNKEQQDIAHSLNKDNTVSDGTFTYFADFAFDVPVAYGMFAPNSEDGQPRGWQLRVGSEGVKGKSGTGFFATMEEALASVEQVQVFRKNNPYVKEQSALYDSAREDKEGIALSISVPKGPWNMKLQFIEPEPNLENPKENGYHAGWCIVAVSPEYDNGKPVFVNPQGYKTRDDAVEARNLVVETMASWDGKDRVVFIEGQGNVAYNNMTSEQYSKLINHYGFQPRPWSASDEFKDYYPKTSYPGD